ncbi:hypothetical protein M5K25_019818 [Dendrobium thyrsiflorum]|uniref:Uncharacterized protein n=1 Tax=Dendrobium thyrsiflorum TaxID=117978 RepID=A0ABD0UG87_DENTH
METQKHFLWTIAGPDSSYSALEIHICQRMNLLECTEGGKDRSSNPDTVFPLWRSDHLDLHAARSKCCYLFAHAIGNAGEHGGASTKNNVSIQILSDIHITFHNGVVCCLMNSSSFHSNQRWLEKNFWASKSLSPNSNNLTIREFIALFYGRAALGGFQFLLIGKNSLNGNIHGRHIESLEHYLCHLFSVCLGIERSFSQQYRVLLRGNTEFIVEGVMPNLFHIIPVAYNSMFNGIFQGKDTSFGLGFISHISILLAHANHDTSVTRSANNAWEHSPGRIITSKSSLANKKNEGKSDTIGDISRLQLRLELTLTIPVPLSQTRG